MNLDDEVINLDPSEIPVVKATSNFMPKDGDRVYENRDIKDDEKYVEETE